MLIEQAKGVLMERLDVTATEAFQRMRAHARANNEKLSAVCRRVLDTNFTPE